MKTLILLSSLILTVQIPGFSQNPDKSLVAEYRFNGDPRDQSMYQNHGMIRGGVVYGMDRFGSKCGAAEFNGTDAFISVPSSRSLESPLNALTVSVWFKTHRNADKMQWFTIVCKGTERSETQNSPQYRLQGTRMTLSLNTDFTEFINLSIQNDDWYHYVMTWDGSMVTSFLDGRQVFTYPYAGKLNVNNQSLYIGRDIPGSDEFFYGSMDQLRIYNRALNSAEVLRLFRDDTERSSHKPCDPVKQAIIPNSNPIVTPNLQGNSPLINILIPNKNPYTTDKSQQTVWANIQGITGENDITVNLNGRPTRQFSYNTKRRMLEMQFLAAKGQNQVEIVAKNEFGSDMATVKIIYTPAEELKADPPVIDQPVTITKPSTNTPLTKEATEQKVDPPTVMIINPSEDITSVQMGSQRVWAKITNISKLDKITPLLNGTPLQQYNFDEKSGLFDANLSLKAGTNTFKITVQNKAGGDSDIRQLIFKPVMSDPVIALVQPASFPAESIEPTAIISAKIKNVDLSDIIAFKVNNKVVSFSFDILTGDFEAQIILEEGYNVFQIEATNQQGSDKVVEQVLYRKPHDPIIQKPDLGTVEVIEEIAVPSKHITISCYDHNRIDGDIVSVVLGDEVLFDKITLQAKEAGKAIKELNLIPGKDYILVSKAWNEGSVPTNTLCLEMSDNQGFSRIIKLNSKEGTSEAISLRYQ